MKKNSDRSITMPEVMVRAIEQYGQNEATPFLAWAGECGLFADFAWHAAKASGVSANFANFYYGELEGDFAWTPPPGLSAEDVAKAQIIEHIDHVWLTHAGKHYDASAPEGVSNLFDLRLVRQVAVELLEKNDPERLELLCAEHAYWRESIDLLKEFREVRGLSIHDKSPAMWL